MLCNHVASLQDLELVSSFYTRDSAELRPGLICCAPSGQSGKHLANSVNHRHNGSMIRIQHTVNLVSDRSDLLDGTGGGVDNPAAHLPILVDLLKDPTDGE